MKTSLDLHRHASAESVAMLRVGVFALAAAEAWVLLGQATNIPAGAFTAFGFLSLIPAEWLTWMLSETGQQAMSGVAIVTAVAAAIGLLPRVSMPLATVALIVTQAIPRGMQGFVNHAQVPLILCALILTLGPSTDALTVWPRPRPLGAETQQHRDYQSTLVLMPLLICLGYVFIAAHRVVYGGWELFSSDSFLQWLVKRNLALPDPDGSLALRIVRDPTLAALAKWSFPLVTVLELSAPFALLSRRYRLFFVPAMLLVHLGIYLLMHISFSQLALLYIVFIDSVRWSPRRLDAPLTGTVFFDGFCGLCNGFVDFLLQRDRHERLRFAPLQGETAAPVLHRAHATGATRSASAEAALALELDTVMYAEGGTVLYRSTAALAAVSRLGGLWSFAAVLALVPIPVRDFVYDFVARHRYRWFGKRDACRLPTADERARFLP